MTKKKLGRAIRDARKQNALTQAELAAKLKVTQGAVWLGDRKA
jgi:transcriptional regulator with XRE-family HTH domain